MSEKNTQDNNKNKEDESLVLVGAYIPREKKEYLDAIVMANEVRSKAQIVQEAIDYYIEEKLPDHVRKGADDIIKARRETHKEIEKNKREEKEEDSAEPSA